MESSSVDIILSVTPVLVQTAQILQPNIGCTQSMTKNEKDNIFLIIYQVYSNIKNRETIIYCSAAAI